MKQLPITPLLLIAGLVCVTDILAQQTETSAGRVSPKELAISPSPIFDLMAATPTQVTRMADIKDFKVDW